MSELTMTIGGEALQTKSRLNVLNPATGEPFSSVPDCSAEQLDKAFAAAKTAQSEWARDEEARRDALRRVSAVLEGAARELGALLTEEQGKPLIEAVIEIRSAAKWFSYYADLELPAEVLEDDDKRRVEVLRRPVGVVAAITPWNFPVQLAAAKLAPALAAGNAVVLKPSPYTPVTTLRIGELLRDVLPPGVLNVVSGGDELGARMTRHPVPRKISFTGSISAGKQVASAAALDLKRVTLELGGNDAAILLDDVDVDAIANDLFWSAFRNNGQVCAAVKRVYAPERIYEEVVEALATRAKAAKVGDGAAEGTELGPINNRPQLDRVVGLVEDAVAGGGRVVAGGTRLDRPGFFFTPTIIADVDDSSRIVAEEQFGPALPIVAYRDAEDAVAKANATSFGLSGSVWGKDVERAASLAAELECGTTYVNAHLVGAPYQPFGGFKWSGIGVENGPWGYHSFTELQVAFRSKR